MQSQPGGEPGPLGLVERESELPPAGGGGIWPGLGVSRLGL